MQLVPLSSIIVPPNRQRREFSQESLNDLSESIRVFGLLHPIVVAPDPNGYRLVAGERRFRAISSMSELGISFTCGAETCASGNIPITLLSELGPLTLREIELEENIKREDLTWQERMQAISDLDALRKEQSSTHSTADTARELFGYTGAGSETVRNAILLSSNLSDPDIAKAKTASEAVKILAKKKAVQHREMLAASLPSLHSDHTLIQGDSRDVLTSMEEAKYSCVLTDPPYGVDADSFGSQATTVHNYSDTPDYALSCYAAIATEGYRLTLPRAHAYIFCTIELFPQITLAFAAAGWTVWPRPLIWYKGNGMLPRPDHGPRYTYEAILFASKGDRPVLLAGKHDVLSYPSPSDKIHAAEKPLDLLVDLLSRSCNPGEHILDAFAGSGSIFPAAAKLKLRVTAIELAPENIVSCKLRMQEAL